MKKWILKAIVQKTISYMPLNHKINYLFQKYVTKGVYLNDDYFYDRLSHAQEHLAYFKKYTNAIPSTTLELGTGWYPLVPISFFLSGVNIIYTVDITLLTNKDRVKTTIERFLQASNSKELEKYIVVIPERLTVLQNIYSKYESLSFEEIVGQLNIQYLIEDARKLSLGNDTIDLVNSNNTFEHIYPEILKDIIKDFNRVVKKDKGLQSHFIDMSDHFAHFDKTISVYNFLKFSDAVWKWIDNDIQPQSRLRFADYKRMYNDLNISISEETIRKGDLKELATIKVADKYAQLSSDEVAITHAHIVTAY